MTFDDWLKTEEGQGCAVGMKTGFYLEQCLKAAFESGFQQGYTAIKKGEPMQHELKIWPENFQALVQGLQPFQLRKNDRGFAVDDILILKEWDPETEEHTGNAMRVRVTYIMQGVFGLPADLCIMTVR